MLAQLYKRAIKFIHAAYHSKNTCVQMCSLLALHGSYSTTCKNINYIASTLHISKYSLFDHDLYAILNNVYSVYKPEQSTVQTAQQIRDLLFLSTTGYDNFSKEDFQTMLYFLCCE